MKTIAMGAVDAVLSELRREFVRGCKRDCHGYYDDYPSCSPRGCEQARHIALLDEAIQHLREADEDLADWENMSDEAFECRGM